MSDAGDMRTIDRDGRAYAYRTVGEGPPLLLLNGYAATAMDWDPRFLAALGTRFEVLCPDHAGMGASAPGEITIDAMAADAEALLDALGIGPAPVAGWSMGGMVAQRMATRSPARVEALVLLATDAGGPDAISCDRDVWRTLTDTIGTPREQASGLVSVLFPPPVAEVVDREFGDVIAAARSRISHATLRAQEATLADWHEHPQPPPDGPAPPVLAAAGTADVVIPAANLDLLVAHWSGCRSERFEGAGHAFMAEDPAGVADLIAAFAGR